MIVMVYEIMMRTRRSATNVIAEGIGADLAAVVEGVVDVLVVVRVTVIDAAIALEIVRDLQAVASCTSIGTSLLLALNI